MHGSEFTVPVVAVGNGLVGDVPGDPATVVAGLDEGAGLFARGADLGVGVEHGEIELERRQAELIPVPDQILQGDGNGHPPQGQGNIFGFGRLGHRRPPIRQCARLGTPLAVLGLHDMGVFGLPAVVDEQHVDAGFGAAVDHLEDHRFGGVGAPVGVVGHVVAPAAQETLHVALLLDREARAVELLERQLALVLPAGVGDRPRGPAPVEVGRGEIRRRDCPAGVLHAAWVQEELARVGADAVLGAVADGVIRFLHHHDAAALIGEAHAIGPGDGAIRRQGFVHDDRGSGDSPAGAGVAVDAPALPGQFFGIDRQLVHAGEQVLLRRDGLAGFAFDPQLGQQAGGAGKSADFVAQRQLLRGVGQHGGDFEAAGGEAFVVILCGGQRHQLAGGRVGQDGRVRPVGGEGRGSVRPFARRAAGVFHANGDQPVGGRLPLALHAAGAHDQLVVVNPGIGLVELRRQWRQGGGVGLALDRSDLLRLDGLRSQGGECQQGEEGGGGGQEFLHGYAKFSGNQAGCAFGRQHPFVNYTCWRTIRRFFPPL